MAFILLCTRCQSSLPIGDPSWRCPRCGGTLTIQVEPKDSTTLGLAVDRTMGGIWRYGGLIPFSAQPVTLGEGGTPVISRDEVGCRLLLKLEYISPTGSFKDRGASVSLTRAKTLGIEEVLEDSSGNAGVAASAYAARAGIKARIYVPRDAPSSKKQIMRVLGATVMECTDRDDAAEKAKGRAGGSSLYIGHGWDPFYIEGMKTIAFEVHESGLKIDSVIVPTANGTILLGIHRGFELLLGLGLLERLPAIHAVQGEGCAPLYEALHGKPAQCRSSDLADGLRIRDPPRKEEILRAVRETGGDVYVVADQEIAMAVRELYRMGITAEATSATAYAAFTKYRNQFQGNVLMPITGTGLKSIEQLAPLIE